MMTALFVIVILQTIILGLLVAAGVVAYLMLRPGRGQWAKNRAWETAAAAFSLMRLADGRAPLSLAPAAPSSVRFLITVADHIRRAKPKKVVIVGNACFVVSLTSIMNGMQAGGHVIAIEDDTASAHDLRARLREQEFGICPTVVLAPVTKRKFGESDVERVWYDLDAISETVDIAGADMLVLPARAAPTDIDRIAAGPDMLPRLSPDAHVFIEYERIRKDHRLARDWRKEFPDLGIRQLGIGSRADELVFLDHKIKDFLPEEYR